MDVDIFKSGDKNNSFRLNAEQAAEMNGLFAIVGIQPPKDLRSAILCLASAIKKPVQSIVQWQGVEGAIHWQELPVGYQQLKTETEAFLAQLAGTDKVTLSDMEFISLMVLHCKNDPTKAYPCDEACEPILKQQAANNG